MSIRVSIFLVLVALLEVGGDALIRGGLQRRGALLLLAGASALVAYGLLVNLTKLDFSRLMGALHRHFLFGGAGGGGAGFAGAHGTRSAGGRRIDCAGRNCDNGVPQLAAKAKCTIDGAKNEKGLAKQAIVCKAEITSLRMVAHCCQGLATRVPSGLLRLPWRAIVGRTGWAGLGNPQEYLGWGEGIWANWDGRRDEIRRKTRAGRGKVNKPGQEVSGSKRQSDTVRVRHDWFCFVYPRAGVSGRKACVAAWET